MRAPEGPKCPFQAGFAWFFDTHGQNAEKDEKKWLKMGPIFERFEKKAKKSKIEKRTNDFILLRKILT